MTLYRCGDERKAISVFRVSLFPFENHPNHLLSVKCLLSHYLCLERSAKIFSSNPCNDILRRILATVLGQGGNYCQ